MFVQGIERQTDKVAVILLQGSCQMTVKKVIRTSLKMCWLQSRGVKIVLLSFTINNKAFTFSLKSV